MSELVPSDTLTTLDDLKAKLEAFDHWPRFPMQKEWLRAEAWKAAFLWRNGCIQRYWDAETSDEQKSMELEEIQGLRHIESYLK